MPYPRERLRRARSAFSLCGRREKSHPAVSLLSAPVRFTDARRNVRDARPITEIAHLYLCVKFFDPFCLFRLAANIARPRAFMRTALATFSGPSR